MPDNDEFSRLRSEFPITEKWTYFDHATYGPHPRAYVSAISDWAERLSTDVLGATSSRLEEVRASAARLLHAPVEQIGMLHSTGEATNLVANGLEWQPDDEVILYELDFPSLIAPWLAAGVSVRVVPDRGRNRFDLSDFVELITPRTRAISVSLVNNTTGFRAPVEALGQLCQEQGIWFTVDAVQAVGSVDVDAPALQADIVAAHSYKFLLSGFGQAVVYCSSRALRELRVPHVGLRNLRSAEGLFDSGLQLYDSARRFEPSVPNLVATLAMGASLDLLLEFDPARIEAHNRRLCRVLTDGLRLKGYRLITSERDGESAGLVCCRPADGASSEDVFARLVSAGVQCAVRGGNIRFAPHLYNTEAEVEHILASVP